MRLGARGQYFIPHILTISMFNVTHLAIHTCSNNNNNNNWYHYIRTKVNSLEWYPTGKILLDVLLKKTEWLQYFVRLLFFFLLS